MTEIIEDVVEVNLFIDEQRWLLIDAEVELSEASTPNYVDLIMTPDPGTTLGNLPNSEGNDGSIQDLIGTSFTLEADNKLISNRDTDSEEETLLFSGNLANITPTGENVYEGIAYDPGQQSFNKDPEEAKKSNGSIINQNISIPSAEYNPTSDTQVYAIKVSELIQRIVDIADINDFDIGLGSKDEGVTVENENGSYTGGYDRIVYFKEPEQKISDALEKAGRRSESNWWFDREGTFHFGVPRPESHELRFITDTTAGLTTPPYQSVKVIGSGVVSEEGHERATMNAENQIVRIGRLPNEKETRGDFSIEFESSIFTTEARATIAEEEAELSNSGGAVDVVPGELRDPVFTYRNAEISTSEQAESVRDSLIKKLGKQQAQGEITVVGFPEVDPFDEVVMPNSDEQPMGGIGYAVYRVRHRLNASDGFITKIEVDSPTGVTAALASNKDSQNTTSLDPDDYKVGGTQRQGGPGVGLNQPFKR